MTNNFVTASRFIFKTVGFIVIITLVIFGTTYFYHAKNVGNSIVSTYELMETESINITKDNSSFFDHSPSASPNVVSTNELVENESINITKENSSFFDLQSSTSPTLAPQTRPFEESQQHGSLSFNFTEIVKNFALAKVFQSPISPSDKSWCQKGKFKPKTPTAILYNKMPKAASSTMSGITLRIAYRLGERLYGGKNICANRVDHVAQVNSTGKLFSNRDRSRSFLFSTLRDPAKRSISRIFFDHGKEIKNIAQKGASSNRFILNMLKTTKVEHQFGITDIKRAGFQVAYTLMNVSDDILVYDPSHPGEISNLDHVISMVRRILNDYDFMVLVERFDECIVLMQLLLGLETSDVLYLSAKKSGGYWYHYYTKECKNSVKADISPRVLKYLSFKDWHARNYADYLLIEAVSQSIDLTIDSIGRNKFDEAFEAFQNMKKYAVEECEDKAIFPCNSTGYPQQKESELNCYHKDAGCGYPCLDALQP